MIRRLRDVEVRAISLVKRGANRKRIFLYKSGEQDAREQLSTGRIVKAPGQDWSVFYCVVAEPDSMEDPGLVGEPGTVDVWDSEDEIRKAAWGFMRNGALINKSHEDLKPYGELVENAVALVDLHIGQEVIRKGSWYVAISPTDEGRRMVEAGEFGGVSIEGLGTRVVKSDGDELSLLDATDLALLTSLEERPVTAESLAKAVEHPSGVHPNLDWSPAENWIDRLPKAMGLAFRKSWIYRAAKHLVYDQGMPRSRAFAVAINAAKRGCATGDLNFRGVQQVNAKSRAEMCGAVAIWNAMKARAHADN